MKRRLLLLSVATVLLATGAGTALAQPGAQPDPNARPTVENGPPRAGGPAGPRGTARRERLRQRIRAMRAWYLTEQLQLDDTTAGRLFPILGQFDDDLEALRQRGGKLRRTLRREMDSPRPDPAAVNRLIDALLAHYGDLYRVQRERFAAVRRVVTPAQSARLLLLLPRIDDAVRRQIQRAMGGGGKGNAGALDNPFRPQQQRKNRARRQGAPPDDDAEPFPDPF
jgi:hypothetical protein